MFRKQLGTLTLALSSLVALAAPATLAAHDYDRDRDDRRYSNGRYMSDHERREYEKHLRKEQKEAQRRWVREQQMRNRNGYEYGPSYGYGNPNGSYNRSDGYYDRNGNWHQR